MAANPPSYNDAIKYGTDDYPKQSPNPSEPPYPIHAPNLSQAHVQYPPNQPPTYPPQPQGDTYQAGVLYEGQAYGPLDDNQFRDSGFASFSDKSLRRGFIRKVYLILTAQLLVTCVFIAVLQFVSSLRNWVRNNPWFYFSSYVVFLITYIALICCPSVRRKYPGNFICLAVFTLAFSYMTGTIASFYDTPAVLSAAGMTAVLCLSITIFALQTKVDFTMCSGLILVLCMAFILTGFTCMILQLAVGGSKVIHGFYAGIGILLFGVFLVYDTQLIVGGKNYELSAEDYIEGALQLYLDVVNMFLLILSLFGNRS